MFNANDFATSLATMPLTLVVVYARVSNSLQITLTSIMSRDSAILGKLLWLNFKVAVNLFFGILQ